MGNWAELHWDSATTLLWRLHPGVGSWYNGTDGRQCRSIALQDGKVRCHGFRGRIARRTVACLCAPHSLAARPALSHARGDRRRARRAGAHPRRSLLPLVRGRVATAGPRWAGRTGRPRDRRHAPSRPAGSGHCRGSTVGVEGPHEHGAGSRTQRGRQSGLSRAGRRRCARTPVGPLAAPGLPATTDSRTQNRRRRLGERGPRLRADADAVVVHAGGAYRAREYAHRCAGAAREGPRRSARTRRWRKIRRWPSLRTTWTSWRRS